MWENSEYDIGDFYEVVPNPSGDIDAEGVIKISSGPFMGMVYKYGEYKFTKPQMEDDEPKVQYEFNVIHIPEEIAKAQYPDDMKESFEHLLAEILIDVVMKQIDESVRVDHDEENGEGDIDESFERRVVYKFDNSVSEE